MTSNRRHLVREHFMISHRDIIELHTNDTTQEIITVVRFEYHFEVQVFCRLW